MTLPTLEKRGNVRTAMGSRFRDGNMPEEVSEFVSLANNE